MRIGLLVGSTLHPLAGTAGVDERVHSSAGDFNLDPEAQQQIANYVRGEHAEPIDRGNLLEIVTFSTSRLFATVAEAQLYVLDYDRVMPRSGTLQIDAIWPNGWVDRRHLLNAVVSPPRRRAVGCTVLLDYQVRGSEIVENGTHATGTITFSGVPTAGQTVTIGGRTYTWASSLTAANQVKIGASDTSSALNLAYAIIADPLAAGVAYGAGTLAHAQVTADEPLSNAVTVIALVPGAAGNAIALSETSTSVTVSGSTLTGGAD